MGTARTIARVYSAFAEGGRDPGIAPDTLARITAPLDTDDPREKALRDARYRAIDQRSASSW